MANYCLNTLVWIIINQKYWICQAEWRANINRRLQNSKSWYLSQNLQPFKAKFKGSSGWMVWSELEQASQTVNNQIWAIDACVYLMNNKIHWKSNIVLCYVYLDLKLEPKQTSRCSSVNCPCSPLCNHVTLIGWLPAITPRSVMSPPSSTLQSSRGSMKTGGSRRLQDEPGYGGRRKQEQHIHIKGLCVRVLSTTWTVISACF